MTAETATRATRDWRVNLGRTDGACAGSASIRATGSDPCLARDRCSCRLGRGALGLGAREARRRGVGGGAASPRAIRSRSGTTRGPGSRSITPTGAAPRTGLGDGGAGAAGARAGGAGAAGARAGGAGAGSADNAAMRCAWPGDPAGGSPRPVPPISGRGGRKDGCCGRAGPSGREGDAEGDADAAGVANAAGGVDTMGRLGGAATRGMWGGGRSGLPGAGPNVRGTAEVAAGRRATGSGMAGRAIGA